MRIRVWYAFASNNSGSYTIVGKFGDAAVAGEVARELTEMIAAHDAWSEQHPWEDTEGSPIAAFAAANRLSWHKRLGSGDEWPEHGDPPQVLVLDRQVLVHAPYTISLPRTFGELFYARGGAVDTCLDHAHEPLIAQLEVSWPYPTDPEELATSIAALEAELADPGYPARALLAGRESWRPHPVDDARAPLVCSRANNFDANLIVAAVFTELVEGVRALVESIERAGASYQLHILQALDRVDPLAHLRRERSVRRVTLDRSGSSRKAVLELVRNSLGLTATETWHRLKELPADLGELPLSEAIALAEALRAAGARVTLGDERTLLVVRHDDGRGPP